MPDRLQDTTPSMTADEASVHYEAGWRAGEQSGCTTERARIVAIIEALIAECPRDSIFKLERQSILAAIREANDDNA